jgi:hypothetical protein
VWLVVFRFLLSTRLSFNSPGPIDEEERQNLSIFHCQNKGDFFREAYRLNDARIPQHSGRRSVFRLRCDGSFLLNDRYLVMDDLRFPIWRSDETVAADGFDVLHVACHKGFVYWAVVPATG